MSKKPNRKEITVTLLVDSRCSERRVRELIEQLLCDTHHTMHVNGSRRTERMHIVGVDAGEGGIVLADQPFEMGGESYPHLIGWDRKPAQALN